MIYGDVILVEMKYVETIPQTIKMASNMAAEETRFNFFSLLDLQVL